MKKEEELNTILGYNERHLAQLIRRKMMSRTYKSKKQYTRKLKHKNLMNYDARR